MVRSLQSISQAVDYVSKMHCTDFRTQPVFFFTQIHELNRLIRLKTISNKCVKRCMQFIIFLVLLSICRSGDADFEVLFTAFGMSPILV